MDTLAKHLPNLSIPCAPPSTGCDPSWLLARIEMLLSAYRKTEYRDPESFATQVATNLASFSPEVVEYVTSPTTGLQTRLQWPPSLAEIVEACRAEQAHRDKVARYSAMGPPTKRLPPPMHSGVTGDGGKGTIYTSKAFAQAIEKHGRPIGPFENNREFPYGT